MNSRRDVFFSYAFRPFFLLEGMYKFSICPTLGGSGV